MPLRSSDIFKVLVSAVGQPNCEKGGLDEVPHWVSSILFSNCVLLSFVSLQAFLDLTGLVNERIPKDPEGRATLLAEISSPAQYPLADDDPSGPSWCSNAAVTAPLSPAQPSDMYAPLLVFSRSAFVFVIAVTPVAWQLAQRSFQTSVGSCFVT